MLLQQVNEELAGVVEQARHSLVRISNGSGGNGAGTIWHPQGLIVTNAHVVAQYSGRGVAVSHSLNVTLPDARTLPAQVLAFDPERDLAALSVIADDLPTIELGASRPPEPGEWVMAVGHPWGVEGAVTGGIVIGMITGLPDFPNNPHDWIAVGAHMRPGHSGGPLVDVQGRLVGINTMIAGPDVGFAIPLHAVKAFLKRELTR
ncbi:MAG TPA: trypsin-like peptidase domain-containing protein [Aggregatilineaceae bacterium]|nr:trypsin-like peptidase domain-containing protein [Aggregatilineaceae bacterium]